MLKGLHKSVYYTHTIMADFETQKKYSRIQHISALLSGGLSITGLLVGIFFLYSTVGEESIMLWFVLLVICVLEDIILVEPFKCLYLSIAANKLISPQLQV